VIQLSAVVKQFAADVKQFAADVKQFAAKVKQFAACREMIAEYTAACCSRKQPACGQPAAVTKSLKL